MSRFTAQENGYTLTLTAQRKDIKCGDTSVGCGTVQGRSCDVSHNELYTPPAPNGCLQKSGW